MTSSNPTALITGASAGLGHEFAKLFARNGHDLVLVARNGSALASFADELQRQFGVKAKPFPLDLTVSAAPQSVFDQLAREGIRVDVLVNNAGYGTLAPFRKTSVEELLGQIQLNIAALTHLTKLFLLPMLERKSGKVLNVASTAGFQAGPGMAVYYATKAYVISLSEALAYELSGSGVTVTCLCPGATDTGFQKRAGTENTILFRWLRPMDSKTVARDGYRALMSGKPLVIAGLKNWLLAESLRISPRKLVTAISGKLIEPRG